jgi:uncharacterized membrane protein
MSPLVELSRRKEERNLGEATQVVQKAMWALALKLVWLILLMFVFYALAFFLARSLRLSYKIANTFGSFASLAGFYVWVQYVIS